VFTGQPIAGFSCTSGNILPVFGFVRVILLTNPDMGNQENPFLLAEEAWRQGKIPADGYPLF